MLNTTTRTVLAFLLFLFLLIIAPVHLLHAQKKYDPELRFDQDALKKDLNFLKQTLQEGHPALYWYTTKNDLEIAYEETLQNIRETMTESEFYLLLAPFIEKVKCGHTGLKVSKQHQKYLNNVARFFPLSVWINNDFSTFIRYNNSMDTIIHAGFQLLSINGIPANSLSNEFVCITNTDGYNQTGKIRYAERKFPLYMYHSLGQPDTFHVKVVDFTNDTLMVSVPAMTRQQMVDQRIKAEKKRRMDKDVGEKPKEKPSKTYSLRSNDFNIIENDTLKVAMLRLRGFEGNWFGKFYRRSFREVQKNDIEHLIIDLRENPGGYSLNSIRLMRYLMNSEFEYYSNITMKEKRFGFHKQLSEKLTTFFYTTFLTRKREADGFYDVILIRGTKNLKGRRRLNFDKNVYVLTTGLTSSAASLFTANIHYQQRAIFFGEETGGSYQGCAGGIIPDLTLPFTKLRVNFPLMKFETATQTDVQGRGTFPDRPVTINFSDFAHGFDNQLYDVLKFISENKD